MRIQLDEWICRYYNTPDMHDGGGGSTQGILIPARPKQLTAEYMRTL
jgi:hypothetical protein